MKSNIIIYREGQKLFAHNLFKRTLHTYMSSSSLVELRAFDVYHKSGYENLDLQ